MEQIVDRIKNIQAKQKTERQEKTMPIIGEALKTFTADYPFLSKVLINQIKGGQPIYCDFNHLSGAEERLECCANCNTGSGCLRDGVRYTGSDRSVPVYNPGIIPAGIDDNGRIVYKDCDTWKELQRRTALIKIGVPKIFLNADLSGYNQETKNQREAVRACKEFINAICNDETTEGLLFSGQFGTGKTHLAAAVISELQIRGVNGLRFEVVPRLLAMTRKEMQNKDGNRRDFIEEASRAPVLILDDIASEKGSEWTLEQLFLLVNERYVNQLPTILTTNASLADLEARIGGASVSRILGMCKGYILNGPDYRRKK